LFGCMSTPIKPMATIENLFCVSDTSPTSFNGRTPDVDFNPLQLHYDDLPEGINCYCSDCVELRNRPAKPVSAFRNEMLRYGFKDADGSLRQHIGSDFYDDIVFLLNRINSLPESKPDHILDWAPNDQQGPIPSSQFISTTPETWTPPQIQTEYARYGVPLTKTGRLTKYIITNVRCVACGAVDKQKYPKMNLLGSKKKETCTVDSEYLCDRDACVRSRGVKQDFDIHRLHAGYHLHPHFAPAIHKTLLSWVRSQKKNENDPNLKCRLRYALDTRGRRGIKFKNYENDVAAVTPPSGIHTADSGDSFAPLKGMADRNRFDSSEVRYFENDFVARIKGVVASRPVIPLTKVWFDPSVHKMVGLTFEEKRRIPNYNCFGAVKNVSKDKPTTVEKLVDDLQPDAKFDSIKTTKDIGVTKTGKWSGDPLLWTPGHGLVYPLIPYSLEINKLDAITWRQKVKIPFDGTRVIKTLKDTTGAADEIRQKQLDKLKKIKSQGPVDSFIEDIYIRRNKSMKQVAKEQKKSVPAIKQKIHRELNKPVLTESQQWTRAIESSNCGQDGIYVAATIGGQTRAYLILAATQFADSFEDNQTLIEDGLHNIICDVLERRIKKGRVEAESDLKPMYREVYNKFNRLGWRMLREGVWYQEDQTEVPVRS
jgi:hypothetical protein